MKEGIEKEDIVALYAHRSSAMVVAVMGILKAGTLTKNIHIHIISSLGLLSHFLFPFPL